jgi:hypothetical protein
MACSRLRRGFRRMRVRGNLRNVLRASWAKTESDRIKVVLMIFVAENSTGRDGAPVTEFPGWYRVHSGPI